jgi:hypothetical protein
MAMDGSENWRLCKVKTILGPLADKNEPDEWNGIVHLPTWTYFRIEGETAKIVALGEPPDSRRESRLKKLAVKWFKSCEVSYGPDRPVMVRRGRQYVM